MCDSPAYNISNITPSLCEIMGADKTVHNSVAIEPLIKLAEGKSIDRCLFYTPDAVGKWVFEKYSDIFTDVIDTLPLKVDLRSMIPPKTPVCYASMLSGALPPVHGITQYAKPKLAIPTIFDSLAQAGKRSLIISKRDSSLEMIFRSRPVDVISTPDESTTIAVALDMIRHDIYDFIVVYQCAYDDSIHRTTPESERSISALRQNAAAFVELRDAVLQHWKSHSTLMTFCPDHGVHTDPQNGFGTHGLDIPEDMLVSHRFGIL